MRCTGCVTKRVPQGELVRYMPLWNHRARFVPHPGTESILEHRARLQANALDRIPEAMP